MTENARFNAERDYNSLADLINDLTEDQKRALHLDDIIFDHHTLETDLVEFNKKLQQRIPSDISESEKEQLNLVLQKAIKIFARKQLEHHQRLENMPYYQYIKHHIPPYTGHSQQWLKSKYGEVLSEAGRFLVADKEKRHVILVATKEQPRRNLAGEKADGEWESIVKPGDIIFAGMPKGKIAEVFDPLKGETKYKITWLDSDGREFDFDLLPASRISSLLVQKGLVKNDERNVHEHLRNLIRMYRNFGLVDYKTEIEARGFFLINGKQQASKVDVSRKPTPEELSSGLDVLEWIIAHAKKKDRPVTVFKHSIVAPFAYARKQKGLIPTKGIVPNIYQYGESGAGKTFGLIFNLTLRVWGLDEESFVRDHLQSFQNIRNAANLSKQLDKSSFPIGINEADDLTNPKNADMVAVISLIKNAVENLESRNYLTTQRDEMRPQAMSSLILTTNNKQTPTDDGWLARHIIIGYGAADRITDEAEKNLYNEYTEKNKHKLRAIGNFVAHYVVNENPSVIDGRWHDIAMHLIEKMYHYAGRASMPEWAQLLIKQDNVQDQHDNERQLLRGFFNRVANRSYQELKRISPSLMGYGSDSRDLPPLEHRLKEAIDENIITWMHFKGNETVYITADIVHELHAMTGLDKVSHRQMADIIPGFIYNPIRVKGKDGNFKAVYGPWDKFVEFLTAVDNMSEQAVESIEKQENEDRLFGQQKAQTIEVSALTIAAEVSNTVSKMQTFMGIFRDLAKTREDGAVFENQLLEKLYHSGEFNDLDDIKKTLAKFAAEGQLYQCQPGLWKEA